MFAGLDQHFPIARRGFFVRTRLLHVISASSNEKGLKIISTGSNAADRQDYEGVCGRLLPPRVGIECSGCPNDITRPRAATKLKRYAVFDTTLALWIDQCEHQLNTMDNDPIQALSPSNEQQPNPPIYFSSMSNPLISSLNPLMSPRPKSSASLSPRKMRSKFMSPTSLTGAYVGSVILR